jgi:hypothetical protein
MHSRRLSINVILLAGALFIHPAVAQAQCCLSGLLSGCGCFKKAAPAYAVAPVPAPPPVTPIAPVAPVAVTPPAPAQPVMVPVQQVSYVPETTYRTQYQCVPVTCYQSSCEIDPCTGCAVECMQPVTSYVQKPVSVPVTQYRAVYTTKYVQVQQGATAPAYAGTVPGPAGTAASPFAAPSQTTPQAWGAAGATVPPSVPTQQPVLPPATGSTYQQQIVPQSGTAMMPQAPVQPQPTSPPALSPAPLLKPIPELSRRPEQPANQSPAAQQATEPPAAGVSATRDDANGQTVPAPALRPIPPVSSGPVGGSQQSYGRPLQGNSDMPVVPGNGPTSATRAFPKLLEPTSHTTSWQPSRSISPAGWQPAFTKAPTGPYAQGWQPTYPTAALPTHAQ